MGQEETRRRCRVSGRRRRAGEDRLTKIFTINKGDAIMKKRIIALVLACMLICSIAVTASAATYSGRYGNLLYAATTYCETNEFGAVMEGTPVNGANVADYIMYSSVDVYRDMGTYYRKNLVPYTASSTTGYLANVNEFTYDLGYIDATYKINNSQIYKVQVYAD